MKAIRKRLTYANVMSSIAVFLVIGGGAAFAATNLSKNSVGTRELKPKAVKTAILARNAVRTGKVGFEAIKAGKLAKNAVPTNRLRNNAVTGEKVNESTLGTVPDADKLGGKGSGEYVGKSELLWALVDADAGGAAIVRSRGATSASSPGLGRYLVTFNRDIAACGIVATLADATEQAGPDGEISIDQPIGDSVEVNTRDSDGNPENPLATDGFYIQVTC